MWRHGAARGALEVGSGPKDNPCVAVWNHPRPALWRINMGGFDGHYSGAGPSKRGTLGRIEKSFFSIGFLQKTDFLGASAILRK